MSGPVPSRTGEAFCTSAQHREAKEQWGWLFCSSMDALELLQRFCTASGLAGGHGAEPARVPAAAGDRAGAHCHARPNAYFGEKLVLKQAKLLDFTAAIRPA